MKLIERIGWLTQFVVGAIFLSLFQTMTNLVHAICWPFKLIAGNAHRCRFCGSWRTTIRRSLAVTEAGSLITDGTPSQIYYRHCQCLHCGQSAQCGVEKKLVSLPAPRKPSVRPAPARQQRFAQQRGLARQIEELEPRL